MVLLILEFGPYLEVLDYVVDTSVTNFVFGLQWDNLCGKILKNKIGEKIWLYL